MYSGRSLAVRQKSVTYHILNKNDQRKRCKVLADLSIMYHAVLWKVEVC